MLYDVVHRLDQSTLPIENIIQFVITLVNVISFTHIRKVQFPCTNFYEANAQQDYVQICHNKFHRNVSINVGKMHKNLVVPK